MRFVNKIADAFADFVSPSWGNRRAQLRAQREYAELKWDQLQKGLSMAGGFQSAEQSRDAASWLKSRLSPDSNLEVARDEMLQRADSAYKNYELASSFVEGKVIRVVGQGTQLDPDIEVEEGLITEEQSKKWNNALRKGWERQIKRIGRRGEPLWKIQQVMQRHDDRFGEWFVLVGDSFDPLAPTTLKIENLHPKRIVTPPGMEGDPSVRMGVKLNKSGQVIGYYIRNSHPNDSLQIDESFRYEPAIQPNGLRRVIHHFDKYEEGQTRGYPRMQAGLKRLKNAEEYEEAELERNYVAACHAAFVRTELGIDDAAPGAVVDSSGRLVKELSPGGVNYMGLADEVTFNSPQGPPTSYGDYVKRQDRMWAVACGSSYEVVTNDFQALSYNAARMLWNIEEGTNGVEQKDQSDTIESIYQHFVTRAVTGRLPLVDIDQVLYRDQPWLFWAVRFIPSPAASIDPAREDRNELMLIEANVKSHGDFVERKNGVPRSKVIARIKRDNELLKEADLPTHMPQMNRDAEVNGEGPGGAAPTQVGDGNVKSSNANKDRQAAGA